MSDDLLKDPLPEPWTFGVTKDGRVFFINDDKKITTWLHPDTGQPAMTGYHHAPDLPSGWEQGYSQNGEVYYIDHNTQKTTFQDPKATSSRDNHSKDTIVKKKKRKPSFTETLTRPLYRRSSSKRREKPEKLHVKEKRPSSARPARRSSFGSQKGIKMTVVRNPNAVATRSGWLYKQDSSGVGGMKIWRKRWFVLSDFCLFYYKDGKEDDVLGSIILPSYTVSTVDPDDKINRKYTFKIEHPGMRSYYICAESYNDMAEWVTDLARLCTLPSNQKGSRKSLESEENNKPTEEEQAFGFSQSRPHSKSSDRGSSSSTPSSLKKEPRVIANGNNNNAKISTSSTPSSGVPKQNSISRLPRSSSASNRTHTSSRSSSSAQPRRQNSAPPRRLAGSDRLHSIERHNHRTPELSSDVSTPERRRPHDSSNKVGRTNSMMKLGNWVQTQKMKQQHYNTINTNRKHGYHYDTASEMSSASSPTKRTDIYYHTGPRHGSHRAPSSGKRYKPGTYSDYMDSAEVASSIMSVPPMYRTKVVSLPRPRSSQEIDDDRNRRKKKMNSKSVGYLGPSPHTTTLQTKSEYNLSPNQHSLTSRSPLSANSARGYDDVFSPISNNVRDHRRFKYEAAAANRTPSFHAAISPTVPTSTYEVKQVDVRGKQGQLRAFAISSRTPNTAPANTPRQPAPQYKEVAYSSEEKIEHKLKRLNELDQALQQLSIEMQKLHNSKRLLEQNLNRAKSTYAVGVGSEFELEQKLSKVKSQLAKSTQKLKEMSKENEEFEKEIKKMKTKLLEQLNRKSDSKSNQRQLEWELGRIQLIMEGVHKNKTGFANRMSSFDDESLESDFSPPNSARSGGSTKRISGNMQRSPRDVKRHSADHHSSSSSPYARAPSSTSSVSQESKYFTLPGRGVSRATSVDSLTAASIARFTRPTSARSLSNLHRTKSAAERLLSGSSGNLGAMQNPDEIKKIQKELNLSRIRTLTGDNSRRHLTPRAYMPPPNPQVGIDVQMAIKNHRMPKVLQRAKRDMQRAEAERKPMRRDYEVGFDIDELEADAADQHDLFNDVTDSDVRPAVTELDVEPEDLQVDLNLTHQLIAPDKVEIPDRLLEYEDVELSPAQERLKQKKIRAIESMLSRSGQTASQPTVHLAAALAAEAGTVARAVAYQAQQNKEFHPSLV